MTTSGIGYEIVKAFANAGTQYQVLLGSRDVSKGERAAASMGALSNVNPIQLDIKDDTSVDNSYKAIEQHFGRLDILINNASSTGNDLIDDGHEPTPRELWSHVHDLNVVSTGLFTEKMIPLLRHNKSSKLIFMSDSQASFAKLKDSGKPISPALLPYITSKVAVNVMTLQYALAYPDIRVIAVSPDATISGSSGAANSEESDPAAHARNVVTIATASDVKSGTFVTAQGATYFN